MTGPGAPATGRASGRSPVRSGEVFAALSLATDLGTGQAPEHGLRTCLLALELGELAGLDAQQLEDAYYLGLLHSIGCTADAPVTARAFGDDRAHKAAYTLIDAGRPVEIVSYLWHNAYPAAPAPQRVRAFMGALVAGPEFARVNLRSHCEVGERLGQRLRLPTRSCEGLWFVFERWDGKGMPERVAGERIPVAARILHAARDASAFAAAGGAEMVAAMAARCAGTSLDPAFAALLCEHAGALLERVATLDAWEQVVAAEPRPRLFTGDDLDRACQVIADYADLKSYGTLHHSRSVADVAEAAAWRLGLPPGEIAELRRAAWLHDMGRVGVSAAVWEKPGPLTSGEWEQVRLHSYQTERLLARIPALADLGRVAASDHERLDGTGYHRGLTGQQLPPVARVLAAADVWCAMCEPRAYRDAHDASYAAMMLREHADAGKLAGEAVDAVLKAVGERARPAPDPPAGLTAREVEVLRLLARGLTNKQAAEQLEISPKTVGRHVESIYSKIGASTRAAAALFAVEHDLLRH
jgi:HD-GYP domain-containing protein (c-di-GMP phosphodiesterase class II)/DNA-binding CsgD family transcriptional regulator